MCKFTIWVAEFYLWESQHLSQLSSEKTHFILQAMGESQLEPLAAQSCFSAATIVTVTVPEVHSSESRGPVLSRREREGCHFYSRKEVKVYMREHVHDLFWSTRPSDDIFTIKQHFNALTVAVSLHYHVRIWSLLFFIYFYRKIKSLWSYESMIFFQQLMFVRIVF